MKRTQGDGDGGDVRGTQSLRRAASLLRALSTHGATGWRLSDLAEETGLDHATVHRMLSCLVQERLATRVRGSLRYSLGSLAYELGLAAAPNFAIDRLAGAGLAKLASITRAMVFMNIRSGFDSVCVARHEGRSVLKAYTVDVGTRRPLCLSAGGAAILISLPKHEQASVTAANLEAIAHRGPAREIAVRRMLRRSAELGYGLNFEDIIPGIAALGVPILSRGMPVASLSLATTRAALDDGGRRAVLLDRLRREASKIEGMIGQLRF
jgi:DNA-binding IclR family transcriptional regulator